VTIWRRIRSLFGNKTHAALDRIEDPRDALDGVYRKQIAVLQDARRGVADVLTNEKRLELEAETLRATAERATSAAERAAHAGDDAGARRALRREAFAIEQRDRLLSEIADIRGQRLGLEALTERLRERVELLRTEKVTLQARYTTAKAASRAGENVVGISDDMFAAAQSIERARSASRDAQARAAALTELAGGDFDVERPSDTLIESRLAALKGASQRSLTSEIRATERQTDG